MLRLAELTELNAEIAEKTSASEALFRQSLQQLQTLEKTLSELRESLHQCELKNQESTLRQQDCVQRIEQTGISLPEMATMTFDPLPLEEVQASLQKTQQRLQRLGAVNLTAIAEYAEQSERKTYYDTQPKILKKRWKL